MRKFQRRLCETFTFIPGADHQGGPGSPQDVDEIAGGLPMVEEYQQSVAPGYCVVGINPEGLVGTDDGHPVARPSSLPYERHRSMDAVRQLSEGERA